MPDIDTTVLWNQVMALYMNLRIWFIRQVLRIPAPPLFPLGSEPQKQIRAGESCVAIEILGAGGADQLRGFVNCWALCGYNVFNEFGSQRIERPLEALPPDMLVLGNKAFSINYADICIRWGLYESALRYVGWPIVPGFDVAGVVEAVGKECGFQVGQKVFGVSFFGGYSSRVVVPGRQLMPIPDTMTFEEAASLPAVAATALHATHLAGFWPSDVLGGCKDVLVHSAAGGVGDLLCQVLKLRGLRVVGVVGSGSKSSSCKADVVIDKSSQDWAAEARRHAPEGYRAIFDANGVATLKQSYKLLGRNGRVIVYGFHSNLPKCDGGLGTLSPLNWLRMAFDLLRTPHFDPLALTLDSKAVLGFNLSFFAEERELCTLYLRQLRDWVTTGSIKPPPIRSFTISEVRDAHNALTSGRSVGKMVVSL